MRNLKKTFSAKSKFTNIDTVFIEILKNRKIPNELMNEFLFPKNTEYPPKDLKYLKKACEMTHRIIENKDKSILVISDTDTDGITSGVMIYEYLSLLSKAKLNHTIGQGKQHGLKQYPIEYLKKFDLIIACDSLSSESEIYFELEENNTAVILLDHHYTEIPVNTDNVVTVNSELYGYPNKTLSGAGVCYKFCELYDEMYGFNYAENFQDLAAVGIIADVSSLGSLENRSICYKGLNNLKNPAIKKMLGSYDFTANAVQFNIAPLINACNRMEENELIRLFILCKDNKQLTKLYKLIQTVKAKQDELISEEMDKFNLCNTDGRFQFEKFAYWITQNREVSGVVAQKIAEITKVSTIVLYDYPDDEYYHGSIRARGIENFKEIINSTNLADAQGHSEAAGIKVKKDSIGQFFDELNKKLANITLQSYSEADGEIACHLVNEEFAEETEKFNVITGKDFPKATFIIRNVFPDNWSVLKDKHTKFTCDDITFLMWNNVELYHLYNNFDYTGIDVIGTFGISNFKGQKTINFIIDDYILNTDNLWI